MRRAGACAAEIDRYEVCLRVAEVECEAPNNVLSKFEGVLTWRHQAYALDNDKVSFRPYIFTFFSNSLFNLSNNLPVHAGFTSLSKFSTSLNNDYLLKYSGVTSH